MARPDNHTPIDVMDEHAHKAGEMMRSQVDVVVVVSNLSM